MEVGPEDGPTQEGRTHGYLNRSLWLAGVRVCYIQITGK